MQLVYQIWFLDDSKSHGKWMTPCTLVLFSLLYEIASVRVMSIMSNLYKAVSSRDSVLFWSTFWYALVVVTINAFLRATVSYTSDTCAVYWRKYIVEYIHKHYINVLHDDFVIVAEIDSNMDTDSNRSSEPTLQNRVLDNIDQRITQDTDLLSAKSAQLLAAVAVLPGVVLFYTYYLVTLFGWWTPMACYLYFAVGTVASYLAAKQLVSTVYEQELREGNFRRVHMQVLLSRKEICLLQGEEAELRRAEVVFDELCDIRFKLNRQKYWLSLVTLVFAYAGSIGMKFATNHQP
jgi:ABC-type uncharacterized transport system fused permease/ATPase subunit